MNAILLTTIENRGKDNVELNRPFSASHSGGTKPPCWRAKVALGQDKQRKLPFKIMYVFCLFCPSATFVLQRGGFVPREWLTAKGLFRHVSACLQIFCLKLTPCYLQWKQKFLVSFSLENSSKESEFRIIFFASHFSDGVIYTTIR